MADLSLEVVPSQKNGHPRAPGRHRYQRMSAPEKAEVVDQSILVSGLPKRKCPQRAGQSLRAPTTGGSDAKDQQGLEDRPGRRQSATMEQVLLFQEERLQSCYQPERCQS